MNKCSLSNQALHWIRKQSGQQRIQYRYSSDDTRGEERGKSIFLLFFLSLLGLFSHCAIASFSSLILCCDWSRRAAAVRKRSEEASMASPDVPPAAVTPLRPRLREDARPHPRWRSLLSP